MATEKVVTVLSRNNARSRVPRLDVSMKQLGKPIKKTKNNEEANDLNQMKTVKMLKTMKMPKKMKMLMTMKIL